MVKKCYQKPKERLWKKACERYQNCSEEEKDKMEKKVWDKKMFARKKKKTNCEYMKKYYLAHTK